MRLVLGSPRSCQSGSAQVGRLHRMVSPWVSSPARWTSSARAAPGARLDTDPGGSRQLGLHRLPNVSPRRAADCSIASTSRSIEPSHDSRSSGREQEHVACVGFGDDHGCLPAGCRANRVGLIVAVECVERHRQPGLAGLPLGSLSDGSVGDVAQRAVPPAETGTDPIRELAANGAVGVVHADEAHDPLALVPRRGSSSRQHRRSGTAAAALACRRRRVTTSVDESLHAGIHGAWPGR